MTSAAVSPWRARREPRVMSIHSADTAGSAFGVIPDANFGRFLRFVNISSDAYQGNRVKK